MKNGRLFQILYLLLAHRELTAAWLSEKLEVSQRTIYRDIDALSAAGIPVYARQGQGGGIRLMEQFQMDRQLLDKEEQELLLSSLQSLHSVGAVDDGQLLSRLASLFQRQPVDWLEVDLDSWGGRERERQVFSICKQAIWDRRLMELEYDNSEGEHSRRTVEPVRLCFKGGGWYLSAWCRMRGAMRLFRLNRIVDCRVLKETFSVREDAGADRGHIPETTAQTARKPGAANQAARKPGAADQAAQKPGAADQAPAPSSEISLLLEFTSKAAYQVRDAFAPDEITCRPDGSFLVCTSFPPGRWILGFLLSFGSEVQVLEPEEYRSLLLNESEQIQKLYRT